MSGLHVAIANDVVAKRDGTIWFTDPSQVLLITADAAIWAAVLHTTGT